MDTPKQQHNTRVMDFIPVDITIADETFYPLRCNEKYRFNKDY